MLQLSPLAVIIRDEDIATALPYAKGRRSFDAVALILKYTVAAGLAVTSLASCDLDLVPEHSIAYEEGKQLFLTANDVKAFENGVLSSYRSIHYGVFYYVSDVMCDGFNATIDYGNNYGSVHRCDNSFTSSDYDTEDLWENN